MKAAKLLGPGAAVALLALASRAGAVDYLRGDANQDGRVSISDAHVIETFLFRGGWPPDCRRTMDVNADGKLNITDGILLLNHEFRGGAPPEAPFPEPGSDGDAGAGASLPCDAYEQVPPLDDPAAKLEVLDAVAPGGVDGDVKLVVAVSSSTPLAGLAGTIGFEGEILGTAESSAVDLTGVSNRGFNSVRLTDGGLAFGFLTTLVTMEQIAPGDGVEILELTACLKDGVAAGDYPLTLSGAELVDFATGKAILPQVVVGTLTVLETVAEGSGCAPYEPGPGGENCTDYPDPLPPADAVFQIRGGKALPGHEVTLPFSILSNLDVQAYSFSIDFDEEVLEATGVDVVFDVDPRPGPTPQYPGAGYKHIDINNLSAIAGTGGVDEGFLVGALVFSFLDNCHNIPADEDTRVLDLRFRVRSGTEVTTTEVRFVDGGKGAGQPVRNVITAGGEAWTPDTAGSFVLVNGFVDVLDEIVAFIRGDSNGDEAVDLSDAQATLAYLFLGDGTPYCLDAADTNDDGKLDVADPISTLGYLFLGGPAPPAPFPSVGTDPTADGITCAFWDGR